MKGVVAQVRVAWCGAPPRWRGWLEHCTPLCVCGGGLGCGGLRVWVVAAPRPAPPPRHHPCPSLPRLSNLAPLPPTHIHLWSLHTQLVTVKDLATATALEAVAGGKLYSVVVDTADTGAALLKHGRCAWGGGEPPSIDVVRMGEGDCVAGAAALRRALPLSLLRPWRCDDKWGAAPTTLRCNPACRRFPPNALSPNLCFVRFASPLGACGGAGCGGAPPSSPWTRSRERPPVGRQRPPLRGPPTAARGRL